jgi:hypothetical protein
MGGGAIRPFATTTTHVNREVHGREGNEVPQRDGRVAGRFPRTFSDWSYCVPPCGLEHGRQRIPVGEAEHPGNQFQTLAMTDGDGFGS